MTMEHIYSATRTVEMVAGEKLVLKAEEIKLLDEKVPNNKIWAVTVKFEITETDA